MKPYKIIYCFKFFILCIYANSFAQSKIIEFDSGRWTFVNADTVQHQGRTALRGIAYLEDVEFENGIIEVDIFAYDTTSYPGIVFRKQSAFNYERFYIRPNSKNKSTSLSNKSSPLEAEPNKIIESGIHLLLRYSKRPDSLIDNLISIFL